MYGTNATPADFKRLVKKIIENPVMTEVETSIERKRYKTVYAFLYKEGSTTLRLTYFKGDVAVHLYQTDTLHRNLPDMGLIDLTKLGQAIEDAKTIVSAFYSVDQSTVE